MKCRSFKARLLFVLVHGFLAAPSCSFVNSNHHFTISPRINPGSLSRKTGVLLVDNGPGFMTKGNWTSGFEDTFRRVSGNSDYAFGDMTKSFTREVAAVVEGAVSQLDADGDGVISFDEIGRAVTGNETYQFGDLTRSAVSKATEEFNSVAKVVTGNESYEFGDITKSALSTTEKALAEWRDESVNELANTFLKENFTPKQRKAAALALLELCGVGVLSYGFVANAQSGATAALAWTLASSRAGLSPLSPGQWPSFLHTLASLRIVLDTPLLPARAAAALFLVKRYRGAVLWLQAQFPLQKKRPLVNRFFVVVFAWVCVNGAALVGTLATGIAIGSVCTKVSIFPVDPRIVLPVP